MPKLPSLRESLKAANGEDAYNQLAQVRQDRMLETGEHSVVKQDELAKVANEAGVVRATEARHAGHIAVQVATGEFTPVQIPVAVQHEQPRISA